MTYRITVDVSIVWRSSNNATPVQTQRASTRFLMFGASIGLRFEFMHLPGTGRLFLLDPLQYESDPLTRPDTDPKHSITGPTKVKLGGQCEDVSGARSPEGVTDGDSSTVRIQAVVGDFETVELVRQLT